MGVIDATSSEQAELVYQFVQGTSAEGVYGFYRILAWVAEQEERVQQSFLDLVRGGEREKLEAEMAALTERMAARGMDVVVEAHTALSAREERIAEGNKVVADAGAADVEAVADEPKAARKA
jgi:hypothetical protein